MNATVNSLISYGSDGLAVEIECHLSNSLPNIVIVGAATRTVDEAKERLRGAFSNSGLQMPRKRVSINLAPADIPKDSSSLDLAMAVAILQACGVLPGSPKNDQAFIGELGLDGTIRPVRGLIGKLMAGRARGFRTYYIPASNIRQASLVPHIELIPVDSLRQLYLHLAGIAPLDSHPTGSGLPVEAHAEPTFQLDEITGQLQAKRALEIAAAGGHNLLLNGPPGTGKSMLARALASLLPPLSHEEMLEVTHLHSLTGHQYEQLVTERPVRSPHHSASHVAVIGGGSSVRPGEVSLAHRGVLFFDEIPEFSRPTIEALRQPLEEKTVTVSRAKDSVEYPANFIFVATANPCPCGYHGTSQAARCECPARSINLYRQKLSGPLLDRIDIRVTVERVEHSRLLAGDAHPARRHTSPQPKNVASRPTSPETPQQRVANARRTQARRFGTSSRLNSDMDNRELRQLARITPAAKRILDQAASQLDLSARGYIRTLKVARTIADLQADAGIEPQHVTEALRYRG